MKILDLSAGKRAVWFDKQNPLCTFVDIREEVEPDIVADTRNLPDSVGVDYDLVVFDPPHVNFGKNAQLSQTYGWHTTSEIRDTIEKTAREAHRVTKPEALMAFKWNTHDQKLERVLALMEQYWEPLFGHAVSLRTKHASTTYWVMLIKVQTDGATYGS